MTEESELKKLRIGSRAIRASSHQDFGQVRSHVPPLFQTVNFDYESADHGLEVFRGDRPGYIYTRESNPTTDLFARAVAVLEEGESGLCAASGMAAICAVFLAFTRPGDRVLSSGAIYGGTRSWLRDRLSALDVTTRFVDITDESAVTGAVENNTRILFTEVLGNPNLVLADIRRLSKIARAHDLILVVDNTFTPPPINQPLKLGADLVVHSATKYLGGHGDIIGGVVVGPAGKLSEVHGVLHQYGAVLSPFNAWLGLRGLKTLGLRIERHCANAEKLANFLSNHARVVSVRYPGLKHHPQHELARRRLNGCGGMLTFEVVGGLQGGIRLINAVKLCQFTVSLGEIDTLIMHPASTSHAALTAEERAAIGITDGMIRMSVGCEDVDDLIDDLDSALAAV